MMKSSSLRALSLVCVLIGAASQSFAMTLDWSGNYRAEFFQLDSTSLGNPKAGKSYLLHQMSLSPKIVASDGINVVSRFHVFSAQQPAYANSQLGDFWGEGVGSATPSGTEDSNTLSQNAPTSGVQVSELYLKVDQEYGSLLLGRAPLQFGLGMTHNAGRGEFDHWYDSRDVVGYKFVVGNLSMMPMIAKVKTGTPSQSQNVTDQIFNLLYENMETGSTFGLWFEQRRAGRSANDTPTTIDSTTYSTVGAFSHQNVNVLIGREWSEFDFKIEGGFLTGKTGLKDASDTALELNSYGVATEMNFKATNSKTTWTLNLGMASGDNPDTTDVFEGYFFDRNYDVALLLFNHRLGSADFLRSKLSRNNTAAIASKDAADDEVISNAAYFSPRISYAYTDKLTIRNTFTWAQLLTDPLLDATGAASGTKKDLGIEWDLDLIYKVRENVTWMTQAGLLVPGEAFKGGPSNDFKNNSAFGFATKAAISF